MLDTVFYHFLSSYATGSPNTQRHLPLRLCLSPLRTPNGLLHFCAYLIGLRSLHTRVAGLSLGGVLGNKNNDFRWT